MPTSKWIKKENSEKQRVLIVAIVTEGSQLRVGVTQFQVTSSRPI